MEVDLLKLSTKPPEGADKDALKDTTKELHDELRNWQRKLYAEGSQSLLVVIQGMDASGKGGSIRETFKEVNPLGCRVYPFKKPTDEEFSHDFLWRVHKCAPEKGMISVFDRSHYEDVLIQRVHNWIDMDRVHQRYRHINHFERLLVEENNTTIVKFYLHVSEEEQLERLNERMTDPEKMWKYNANDFEERKRWPDYRKAYEDVFRHCSDAAPWHIIPTDKNWYKEYMIAKVIEDAFQRMNPQYPPMAEE